MWIIWEHIWGSLSPKWPQTIFPSLCVHAATYIKSWDLFSFSLTLNCPWDLLWQREGFRCDIQALPSSGLKKMNIFYILSLGSPNNMERPCATEQRPCSQCSQLSSQLTASPSARHVSTPFLMFQPSEAQMSTALADIPWNRIAKLNCVQSTHRVMIYNKMVVTLHN